MYTLFEYEIENLTDPGYGLAMSFLTLVLGALFAVVITLATVAMPADRYGTFVLGAILLVAMSLFFGALSAASWWRRHKQIQKIKARED